MLTPEDKVYALENGYDYSLRQCGFGGVPDILKVKCLHRHYAHYLATGENLVGEWIQAALNEGADENLRGMKKRKKGKECGPASSEKQSESRFAGNNVARAGLRDAASIQAEQDQAKEKSAQLLVVRSNHLETARISI